MRSQLSCAATDSIGAAHSKSYVCIGSGVAGCRGKDLMFASIVHLFQMWRRYADATRELSGLSDRELADIGVNRSEIQRLAWQHAHTC